MPASGLPELTAEDHHDAAAAYAGAAIGQPLGAAWLFCELAGWPAP